DADGDRRHSCVTGQSCRGTRERDVEGGAGAAVHGDGDVRGQHDGGPDEGGEADEGGGEYGNGGCEREGGGEERRQRAHHGTTGRGERAGDGDGECPNADWDRASTGTGEQAGERGDDTAERDTAGTATHPHEAVAVVA